MRERMRLSRGRRFIWSSRHIMRRALTQQGTFTSRLSTSFIMGMFRQKVTGQTVKSRNGHYTPRLQAGRPGPWLLWQQLRRRYLANATTIIAR
jgi:hypothetical protein